jgi:hypothetical protein
MTEIVLNTKGLKGTKKSCDRCGKEINFKRIHIVWLPDQHAFSWLCGECNLQLCNPTSGGCSHG